MKSGRETVKHCHPSIKSVTFDESRYTFSKDSDVERHWFTPEGDAVGLFFHDRPPDLPGGVLTPDELKDYYQTAVCGERILMVEFDLVELAGVCCVWILLKLLQEPHGATYLGSLTIPFENFSYVLKMQTDELGITGLRETTLLLRGLGEGTVRFDADAKLNGEFNPYSAQFDSLFPDHPLSRLRREFAQIKKSLRVHRDVMKENPFPLPGRGH